MIVLERSKSPINQMKSIKTLVRQTLLHLEEKYEDKTEDRLQDIKVFLDKNENPYNSPTNRYAYAAGNELRTTLGLLKRIQPHCITLTNGTDEAIDFLIRTFCTPNIDRILYAAPTMREYKRMSLVNNVDSDAFLLSKDFQLSAQHLLNQCTENTKIIFLCSPGNPTGNLLERKEIELVCQSFDGLVVIDESYIEFSNKESWTHSISKYNNLVVLNTFSYAFASADLRLTVIYAVPDVIKYINLLIPRYHISKHTEDEAVKILRRRFDVDKWVHHLLEEKRKVIAAIRILPICEDIYPTDTNFFLAKFKDADTIYEYLLKEGIAVRNCSMLPLCENCLRITIGLPHENCQLISALRTYE